MKGEPQPVRQWNSTLSRKAPLKVKAWWKPSPEARKKRPTSKPYKRSKAKGKALKAISAKRKVQVREYTKTRRAWLEKIENTYCAVCIARALNQPWGTLKRYIIAVGFDGLETLAQSGAKMTLATEVHHIFGRRGSLLCDERGFLATCRNCREWPHQNPKEARELELLSSATLWEVAIDKHCDYPQSVQYFRHDERRKDISAGTTGRNAREMG